MATLEDVQFPKKRITTYGKSVRRRVPEHNFASFGPRIRAAETNKSESLTSKSPSPVVAEPSRLKSIPRAPSSRNPSSLSPKSGANIFDVPSSDDEVAPLAPKLHHKLPSKQTVKNKVQNITAIKEVAAPAGEDSSSRKRLKLSPAPSLSLRAGPTKVPPKKALQDSKNVAKHISKIAGHGSTSMMVSRPKPAPVPRNPERARTPPNVSSPTKVMISSTPSPVKIDSDVMHLDSPAKFISPKGMKLWEDLLGPDDMEGTRENPARDGATEGRDTSSRFSSGVLSKSAGGVTKPPQKNIKMLPRRRLIDTLVEQTPEDDMDVDETIVEHSEIMMKPFSDMGLNDYPSALRGQSVASDIPVQPIISASQGPPVSGPKFTYSRHRSMLAEEDLMAQLALDVPIESQAGRRTRRGSIPILVPLQSFHEEEEELENSQTIRSVHELRQAGANNRFNDEIEDFLDRIGKPSSPPTSIRRSGLVDLARKLQDKGFLRQFRASSVEQRLFTHLGQETDIIAGYLMVSILVIVLLDTSMPHIVPHLRRHGITKLFSRLMESEAGIVALGKERKRNMSKMALVLLTDHEKALLDLPIWEEFEPLVLSPRTLALKCLEMMVRQTRETGNSNDIISKELTTKLFQILSTSSDDSSWKSPKGQQAIDFYLALSALESHSLAVRTAPDESMWISDYLPIIADTLLVTLNRSMEDFGRLQVLVLRLTLNVTNNNVKAADVFAKAQIMAVLGRVIVSKFQAIMRFLIEEEFRVVLDHLVLALGTMANLANLSLTGRESLQSLQGMDTDPLGKMVQIFVDNEAKLAEADSVEETQKNVAFGWLAVLLGYLCLLPELSKRIIALQPSKSIGPLAASIEEFIRHHRTVDEIMADEDGNNSYISLAQRLEPLVTQLRTLR